MIGRPSAGAAPRIDQGWAGVKRIFEEVDWSISFVFFLVYVFIVITYRFSGAGIAILAAVGGLIFERGQRRFPPWLMWFAALLVWGAVSFTQSPHPGVAWRMGVLEYGKVFLICVVAANVLTNGARLRFFLIFFLFLYATHPIRGALMNLFFYGHSVQNRAVWNHIFSNPNDMAALTFLPLGMAAGLLKDRNDWVRKGAFASVAVLPFVILLTQSRGAFLALGVFAMMTVLANRGRLKTLVVIGMLGVGSVLLAPEGTFDRFTDFTRETASGDVTESEDSSTRQRLEIWRIARRIITDYPIFGVGMNAYPYEHGRYAFFSADTEIGGGGRDTHSTYLRTMGEVGYPGFAIFVAPFILSLVRARRIRRRFGTRFPDRAENIKFLEAALYALAVSAIFGSYADLVFPWLHLGLLSILTEDLYRVGRRQTGHQAMRRGPPPGLLRVGSGQAIGAAR